MNKIIYYINELHFPNGYHGFPHHRLPQAYMELFPWYSLNWESLNEIKGKGNIVFVQTPVSNELTKLKLLQPLLEDNYIFINQESNIFDWFDWDADTQELYIDILSKCTAFCYHSNYDATVMKIFTQNLIKYSGCTNFFVEKPKKFEQGEYVIVPSPLKGYQRGMISHVLASDNVKNLPIYSTKYTRPKNGNIPMDSIFIPRPDLYKREGIQIVDRMNVDEWYNFIYNSKFGIDIHREFSGGNCSLEFGSLGVPLIGNINLDTQRDIFPDLSFEFNDYDGIKKAIDLLSNDKDFFEEVSNKALVNTKEKYNSQTIVENFKKEVNKFL
jgi:hypothetical protein